MHNLEMDIPWPSAPEPESRHSRAILSDDWSLLSTCLSELSSSFFIQPSSEKTLYNIGTPCPFDKTNLSLELSNLSTFIVLKNKQVNISAIERHGPTCPDPALSNDSNVRILSFPRQYP